MKMPPLLAAALTAALLGAGPAQAETNFGHYIGEFVARFAPDGRNVVLEQSLAFVDPVGKQWSAPVGTETDGASVPKLFWAMYPPFTGNYRSAAVIHDHYCRTHERSWQETHKVFYYAMRASNVDENTAKVLFGAVYWFGPRWGPGVSRAQRRTAHPASDMEQAKFVQSLQAWVVNEDPDLDSLVSHVEQARPTVSQPNSVR
jgi:hypothetical protein